MFNIQKCIDTHEIYINYNEYLDEEDDESIPILEHMVTKEDVREFNGVIDLIDLKKLSKEEIDRIKSVYRILKNGNLMRMFVICNDKRVLKTVKRIMPDITVRLIKI